MRRHRQGDPFDGSEEPDDDAGRLRRDRRRGGQRARGQRREATGQRERHGERVGADGLRLVFISDFVLHSRAGGLRDQAGDDRAADPRAPGADAPAGVQGPGRGLAAGRWTQVVRG